MVSDEAPYRIGLRVDDVDGAALFYEGLGFDRLGDVPGPDGRPVMIILRRERYAECVDPYGYAWKFYQSLPGQPGQPLDSLAAAHDSWFSHEGQAR